MVSHFRNISNKNIKLEFNITSKTEFWNWVLTSSNLQMKKNLNISIDKPWFYAEFSDFLRLLDYDLDTLDFTNFNRIDFNEIDWSFLKSNRYQNSEVFKEQNILLENPLFICDNKKILTGVIDSPAIHVAEIVYDYYRRFIPFLYSFLKLMRVQQVLSLEIKLPVIDMFFSNFGDIDTGEFNSSLPFDDEKLLLILKTCFTNYYNLRKENKFGRAFMQLSDLIKGIAEYLKIITTVNYIDFDLMSFLHNSFMSTKFEQYSSFFSAAGEEFLLDNLGWTYTKAFQISGI